jgi:Domain of unknown function (DUF6391)
MGRARTFACVRCRIVIDDGGVHETCPTCAQPVVTVDGRFDVWLCESCNTADAWPGPAEPCAQCGATLARLSGPVIATPATLPIADPDVTDVSPAPRVLRRIVGIVVSADLAIVLLGLWYLAVTLAAVQLVLILLLVASYSLDAGVVHGLEHATIAILVARGLDVVRGSSRAGWFSVVAERGDHTARDLETMVRESAEDAIRRIRAGEHALAYSDDCGARVMIGELCGPLLAGMIALVGSLWLAPWIAIVLAVAFAAIVRGLAGPLAIAMQRWRTVSTDFADAVVSGVDVLVSRHRQYAHAVVSVRASSA